MQISDAKPGDVLVDRDGDVWARRLNYAVCVVESGAPVASGKKRWIVGDAEQFGPFTRLVPEIKVTIAIRRMKPGKTRGYRMVADANQ